MQLQGLKVVKLLSPVSAANTSAATSAWIDIGEAEGDVIIQASVGAITGGIVWALHHATANDGTGDAAITPDTGAFAAVTANTSQIRIINANALNQFIQLVGTITTGPVLVSANVIYQADQP